jgi:hypothetical protein
MIDNLFPWVDRGNGRDEIVVSNSCGDGDGEPLIAARSCIEESELTELV